MHLKIVGEGGGGGGEGERVWLHQSEQDNQHEVGIVLGTM